MSKSDSRPDAFVLGVVMLDTRFPRLPGDIGNPATFPFETRYRRVARATVAAVVGERPDRALEEALVGAGRALAEEGADLVATSCGFLAHLQERLSAAVTVPVLASSLVLLDHLRAVHGAGRPLGVLTFDAERLRAGAFSGLGAETPVEGLPKEGELYGAIAGDRTTLDRDRAAGEAVEAARRLVARAPEVPAILLECTNLSPYRREIAEATGLPVHDLNQAILWHASAGRTTRD